MQLHESFTAVWLVYLQVECWKSEHKKTWLIVSLNRVVGEMTTWSPCCTYGLFIDLYIAVNYACNIMYQYWVIVPNLYLISCVHLIILASLIVQFTWTHFPEHVIYFSLSVNHLKPLLVHWLFLKSRVLKTIAFKDDFYYLLFSIDFFLYLQILQ